MKKIRILTSAVCFLALVLWSRPADCQNKQEDYETTIEKKLAELGEYMKELKVQAEDAAGKAKIELQESMKELEKKMAAANDEWRKFKESSADAWGKAKARMDAVMRDLQRYYEQLAARLKQSTAEEQS